MKNSLFTAVGIMPRMREMRRLQLVTIFFVLLGVLPIQARKLEEEAKFDAALSLMERALAVAEKKLGPEHPIVSWPLRELAGLYVE